MIMTVVKGGLIAMEEATCCQLYGVTKQLEIEVGGGVDVYLACISPCNSHFTSHFVVESFALCLAQLPADVYGILVISGCSHCVGEREMPQFVTDKSF